jgi:hypothetical protein
LPRSGSQERLNDKYEIYRTAFDIKKNALTNQIMVRTVKFAAIILKRRK